MSVSYWPQEQELQRGFEALAAEYWLLAIYVFGSGADEVSQRRLR